MDAITGLGASNYSELNSVPLHHKNLELYVIIVSVLNDYYVCVCACVCVWLCVRVCVSVCVCPRLTGKPPQEGFFLPG